MSQNMEHNYCKVIDEVHIKSEPGEGFSNDCESDEKLQKWIEVEVDNKVTQIKQEVEVEPTVIQYHVHSVPVLQMTYDPRQAVAREFSSPGCTLKTPKRERSPSPETEHPEGGLLQTLLTTQQVKKEKYDQPSAPVESSSSALNTPSSEKSIQQQQCKTQRNKVLNGQARKTVYDVYCFMKKEAEDGVASNLKEVQKRTALATNTSITTVRRILKTVRDSDLSTAFKTPGKKRPRAKPVTGVDNFDKCVIKRCIHNFHLTNKELPTIEKLRKKLQIDLNFQGSERSLRRIISELGFKWKKTENNRKVLIEKSKIRLQRIESLQKLKKYRQEGKLIIYTGETYVDSTHTKSKSRSDSSAEGLKKPAPRGKRIVIVHAGTETGFVPNALLTFQTENKPGDCRDHMNFDEYEKWLRTKLMPNIPSNSVVVVDNASYHSKQYDRAPSSNSKKDVMQEWLKGKGIPYTENMLKPQLYNLIEIHKDQFKKFYIDRILAENNHIVLRLPPYHPDLNPIEMAWTEIKEYISSKNVAWNMKRVTELVKEKVNAMGKEEWEKLCGKVKNIEDEYIKSDHVVDMMTEEFVICVDDDDSDSGSFYDEEEDSEDDED